MGESSGRCPRRLEAKRLRTHLTFPNSSLLKLNSSQLNHCSLNHSRSVLLLDVSLLWTLTDLRCLERLPPLNISFVLEWLYYYLFLVISCTGLSISNTRSTKPNLFEK